ncbi:MAG: hypothetical protein CO093_04610 [Alphaproteobacteria bacterium CG_4_9_14_3_um_filter_47_13]|nr:MAG: hypothetical protein CO093_04610 [Alphaproteobacteria bacterium CG_4_9_14_3_um_filter_47_13]
MDRLDRLKNAAQEAAISAYINTTESVTRGVSQIKDIANDRFEQLSNATEIKKAFKKAAPSLGMAATVFEVGCLVKPLMGVAAVVAAASVVHAAYKGVKAYQENEKEPRIKTVEEERPLYKIPGR